MGTGEQGTLSAVIAEFYADAVEGRRWDAVKVHSALDANLCTLLIIDEHGLIIDGSASGIPYAEVDDYAENWASNDELASVMLARAPARAVRDDALMSREKLKSRPVFEGFYEPNGIAHLGVGYQPLGNGLYCAISAQNGWSAGPVGRQTLARIDLLTQQFRQALQISERLRALKEQARIGDDLLLQWGLGLIHCDMHGVVHTLIGNAEGLLTRYRGIICCAGGRLRVLEEGGSRRLRSLLRDPNYGAPFSGPSMSVRDPLSGAVLELTILDFRSAHETDRLVVLREANKPYRVDRHYLRRRFQLTPVQADVMARLMLGSDLTDIAEARGSTLETIRSYLKTLRKKLGCASQGQLISLGWRTVGFVPGSAAGFFSQR